MQENIHKTKSGVYRLSEPATNVCRKYGMTASKTIVHLDNVCRMLQEETTRLIEHTKNLSGIAKPAFQRASTPIVDPNDTTPRDKFGRPL